MTGAYKKIAGTYHKLGGAYDSYDDKNLKGVNIKYPRKFTNAYESPLLIPCDRLRE